MGLPIISIATTPTSCITKKLKKKKSNTYFIINNDKVQQLDFPMNEHLHLEKKREKVTKREDVTKEGGITWQWMVSYAFGKHER